VAAEKQAAEKEKEIGDNDHHNDDKNGTGQTGNQQKED
jgi:hypothetical protein